MEAATQTGAARISECRVMNVVDRGLEFGETIVTGGQLRLPPKGRRRPKHKVVR